MLLWAFRRAPDVNVKLAVKGPAALGGASADLSQLRFIQGIVAAEIRELFVEPRRGVVPLDYDLRVEEVRSFCDVCVGGWRGRRRGAFVLVVACGQICMMLSLTLNPPTDRNLLYKTTTKHYKTITKRNITGRRHDDQPAHRGARRPPPRALAPPRAAAVRADRRRDAVQAARRDGAPDHAQSGRARGGSPGDDQGGAAAQGGHGAARAEGLVGRRPRRRPGHAVGRRRARRLDLVLGQRPPRRGARAPLGARGPPLARRAAARGRRRWWQRRGALGARRGALDVQAAARVAGVPLGGAAHRRAAGRRG